MGFLATVASATVTLSPGSTPQIARVYQYFPVAPRLLVTDASGAPVAGAYVAWILPFDIQPEPGSGGNCVFNVLHFPYPYAGWDCWSQADEKGVVQLPMLRATALGTFIVTIDAQDGLGHAELVLNAVAYTPVMPLPPVTGGGRSLQDMWWSGSAENGWGMSIAQHGDGLFSVVYAYDDAGIPTWYVMPSGDWNYSQFVGPIYSPRSSPFFAYDAAQFRPGEVVGSITLGFDGPDAAWLFLYSGTDGAVVYKPIIRQDFSSDAASPISGLGDMWWGGPEQNGWGISIMEQKGGLFAVWLTYDAAGKPTWFVMPSGAWSDSSTYAGPIYRTRSSPWLGVPYDASKLRAVEAGSFTLHFFDPGHARFDYQVDDKGGTLELSRQPF